MRYEFPKIPAMLQAVGRRDASPVTVSQVGKTENAEIIFAVDRCRNVTVGDSDGKFPLWRVVVEVVNELLGPES